MKKVYNLLQSKMVLAAAMIVLMGTSAKALTYTAAVSGNFNAAATWGGIAPGATLTTGDVVIIPSGITVTLNTNETFNLTSALTVDGTLTSGANATALIMTSGTLAGSGAITVDSMVTGITTGLTYAGTLTAQNMTSLASTFSGAATVTVANNLYLTGGALNIMAGSLSLSNNANIIVNGGTLTIGGSGALGLSNAYNVTYNGSSANASLELTGAGLHNVTVNLTSGAITLSTDLNMNGTLTLTSGNLILNGNDLNLDVNGDFAASGTGTINTSAGSNISINATNSLNGALRFGAGNNTVNNLSINLGNTSSNVNLGSDLTVNGTLTLGMGTLTLNSNDLTLAANADFASVGTGAIVSTSGSNISVTSNNNFTGAIRFSASGHAVNNLTINMGNNASTVNFGSDLTVNGALTLTAGRVNVGTHNLSIAVGGSVSGGSNNSFVITSNGGRLTMNLAASGSNTYHVGTMLHYAPAVVIANTGSASSDISVMVMDSVRANGLTGAVVSNTMSLTNATWDVTSTATTGLDLNLQVMWSANMEVNAFDRTHAHISHYTAGNWDAAANASATTAVNGMYTINRDHIMSLSPFTVADQNAPLKVNTIVANTDATLYPNPATEVVYYTAPVKAATINIYDVSGRMVKAVSAANNSFPVGELAPGYYSVRITGQDYNSVQHFVKQ